jgi:hypothetical protein
LRSTALNLARRRHRRARGAWCGHLLEAVGHVARRIEGRVEFGLDEPGLGIGPVLQVLVDLPADHVGHAAVDVTVRTERRKRAVCDENSKGDNDTGPGHDRDLAFDRA